MGSSKNIEEIRENIYSEILKYVREVFEILNQQTSIQEGIHHCFRYY